MPKAKRYRGRRQTQPSRILINLKKENGRPKGTYKRFRFEQTRLGFFLKYEVPVVYDILQYLAPLGLFPEPPYLLIKKICEASSDPSLQKPKFSRYLLEYKRNGLCCRKAILITPQKEAYYKGIRDKKMHRFIASNSGQIEGMLKNLAQRQSQSLPKVLSTLSISQR